MIGQALFWRNGGADYNGMMPGSLKDTPGGSLKDTPEGGPFALVDGPRTWRLWAAGLGEGASFRDTTVANQGNLDWRTWGIAMGFDYQVSPTTLAGIAGGYTNSRFSADQLQTNGSVEGAHVGLYGVQNLGPAYLMGTAQYAGYFNNINRSLQWLTLPEQAKGKFTGDDFSGRVEAGLRQSFGGYSVTPFAGGDVSYLKNDGFTEDSVGLMGLTYGANSATSLRSSLGVQLDTRIADFCGQNFAPFVRAAWVHEFNPNPSLNSYLTLSPDAQFSVTGIPGASDAAKVDAGVKFDLAANVSAFAQFDGEFSPQGQSYGGNAGVKIRW